METATVFAVYVITGSHHIGSQVLLIARSIVKHECEELDETTTDASSCMYDKFKFIIAS